MTDITPEMAQQELARRELARRELAKRSQANSMPQPKPGLLEQAGNFAEREINQPTERYITNPLASAAGGFEQGLANRVPGAINAASWGINKLAGTNIQKVPMFDFAPHNTAADVGNMASFFSGPGIAKAIGRIPELANIGKGALSIPMIAKGLTHAQNMLNKSPFASKVAGNALLGASYSPDNPLVGGIAGAAAPLAGKVIEKVATVIKNAFNKTTPKEVATSIQSAHDSLKKYAVNLFDTVEREATARGVNNVNISKDLITELLQYLPKTRASKKLIEKAKTGDYSALRKAQTELWQRGTSRKASDIPSSQDEGEEMFDLRDKINESISNHFKKTGNEYLSDLLNYGRNVYKNLKETYYSHPTISKLVHESTRKVPKNIVNVLSEDSVPMERVRNSNPLIAKNLEAIKNKQNSLKKLKYLGGIGGVAGTAIAAPHIYHTAKNALME